MVICRPRAILDAMAHGRSAVVLVGCAVATVLGSRSARAAPEDLALAESLFDEGRRLLDAGQVDAACPKLAESRRLDPQIGVTLFLAECERRAGRLATAWGLFRDAAAAADAKRDSRAALARERAAQLEPRLSKVVITVPASSKVEGLSIALDGKPIASAGWGVPIPVDPGAHSVVSSAPGHQSRTEPLRVEGEQTSIEIRISRLELEAPIRQVALPTQEERSFVRPLGWTLLGAGAVGIGLGAYFGISAANNASDAKDLCPDYPSCRASVAVSATDANDAATADATISTVSLAVGGAFLAAGIVLVLVTPAHRAAVVSDRGIVRLTPGFTW